MVLIQIGTVTIAKKPGFAMSLWLHGDEDFISEAGAMNVFIIKQAQDGCELLSHALTATPVVV
jgi:branched-chain amino acid aminotransferase